MVDQYSRQYVCACVCVNEREHEMEWKNHSDNITKNGRKNIGINVKWRGKKLYVLLSNMYNTGVQNPWQHITTPKKKIFLYIPKECKQNRFKIWYDIFLLTSNLTTSVDTKNNRFINITFATSFYTYKTVSRWLDPWMMIAHNVQHMFSICHIFSSVCFSWFSQTVLRCCNNQSCAKKWKKKNRTIEKSRPNK